VLAALQDSLDDLRLLMDSADMGRQLRGALVAWRSRWDPRLTALDIALDWEVSDELDTVNLHADAVLQVMRILQEATANVVKHAGATRMRLRVRREASGLRVEVCDNGAGLPAAAPRPGARGLRNMQNRARLLGGQLVVESLPAPERGTRVALQLPLPV
jgi:signal transduction histidine kinase